MPVDTYSDAEILNLLMEQPEQGICTLQKQYGGLIFRIASRILTDCPQDAEEIASDILVLTWKQAHHLQSRNQPLTPWLIVTTRNRAIDRWRLLRRKGTLPFNEDLRLIAETSESDGEARIGSLVQEMSDPDKEIFLRRYYRMESAREIGEALGMEPNTVNVRLARGREKLKRKYLNLMGKE